MSNIIHDNSANVNDHVEKNKKEKQRKTNSNKVEIIRFWFLGPTDKVSDRGMSWGLYNWTSAPNPDEMEIEVEVKRRSNK